MTGRCSEGGLSRAPLGNGTHSPPPSLLPSQPPAGRCQPCGVLPTASLARVSQGTAGRCHVPSVPRVERIQGNIVNRFHLKLHKCHHCRCTSSRWLRSQLQPHPRGAFGGQPWLPEGPHFLWPGVLASTGLGTHVHGDLTPHPCRSPRALQKHHGSPGRPQDPAGALAPGQQQGSGLLSCVPISD